MFGSFGKALKTSLTFVSQAGIENSSVHDLGLTKTLEAVYGCRNIGKKDMVHNNWLPHIAVDPQTYQVMADGKLLSCDPVTTLAMAQRYFLF
jgi:urease subunit alpha